MDGHSQFATILTREFVEQRSCPRYRLETDIRVYPRNSAVIRGHTVDIGESGIAAMLPTEVPLGEVVRLEFTLPFGDAEILATVRQKVAFRYGFQFVDPDSIRTMIRRTCRSLTPQACPFSKKP